jgi:hypothetical protein
MTNKRNNVRKLPISVVIIAIWFLLRASGAIWKLTALARSISLREFAYLLTVEGIVWIVLAVGLLRFSNPLRILAIVWSVVQVVWASYGFIASSSWHSHFRVSIYLMTLTINLFVIVFLSRVRWHLDASAD